MSRPEAPSNAPREHMIIRGRTASFIREGERGPPLVILHGLPGGVRDFRWLTPALMPRQAIRLEMPGSGDTDVSLCDVSVTSRAAFVLEFMRALGVERAVLVGHSMGGVVAAAAANLEPDRVLGVGFISSPGLRVHRGFKMAPYPLIARILRNPLGERLMRSVLERSFIAGGFRHSTAKERAHTLQCVAATSMAEHVTSLNTLEQPRFSAYCLDDPLVDPEILRDTARALGGPCLELADGGHNPQKPHANELAEALLDWSAGLQG